MLLITVNCAPEQNANICGVLEHDGFRGKPEKHQFKFTPKATPMEAEEAVSVLQGENKYRTQVWPVIVAAGSRPTVAITLDHWHRIAARDFCDISGCEPEMINAIERHLIQVSPCPACGRLAEKC